MRNIISLTFVLFFHYTATAQNFQDSVLNKLNTLIEMGSKPSNDREPQKTSVKCVELLTTIDLLKKDTAIEGNAYRDLQKALETKDQQCNDKIASEKAANETKQTEAINIERENLEREIAGLTNQPYTFSNQILQSFRNRIKSYEEKHKLTFDASKKSQLERFITNSAAIEKAKEAIKIKYSPAIESHIKELQQLPQITDFPQLQEQRTYYLNLLANYCELISMIKTLFSETYNMSDLRKNAISAKKNLWARDNYLKEYPFLLKAIDGNIINKDTDLLSDIRCQ